MADLATLADLTAVLQRSPADLDEQADMEAALARASALIRRLTKGVSYEPVANDSVTLDGTGTRLLRLPQAPVTDVASVTLRGVAMAESAYQWADDGLLRRPYAVWPREPRVAVVVYSHGFASIPEDIVGVCANLAARSFENPQGFRSETLDQYSYNYGSAGPALLDDLDRAVLDSYRPLVVA